MNNHFVCHTEQYAAIRKNRWFMWYRKVKVKFTLEQTTKVGVE
jgi:hypothetical protein